MTVTPRSRRVARLAWVAASAYMRSFIAGATSARRRAGEEGGGQQRVADAGGELGDRVRGGGGNEVGVGVLDHVEMADRVVRGRLVARERATHRIALELAGQHRGADDRLERGGADEALRGGRHRDAHAVARLGRQARELERLVGGDAAAYAEQDAGHLRRPAGAHRPPPRRGSGSWIFPAASSSSAIVR